jgi:hypothetical protein
MLKKTGITVFIVTFVLSFVAGAAAREANPDQARVRGDSDIFLSTAIKSPAYRELSPLQATICHYFNKLPSDKNFSAVSRNPSGK